MRVDSKNESISVFSFCEPIRRDIYLISLSTHSPLEGVLINVKDLPNGTKWLAIVGYNRWAFEVSAGGGDGCGGEGRGGDLAFCIDFLGLSFTPHAISHLLLPLPLLLYRP